MPYKRECNNCGEWFDPVSKDNWICSTCKKQSYKNKPFRSNYQIFRTKISLLSKEEKENLLENVFD